MKKRKENEPNAKGFVRANRIIDLTGKRYGRLEVLEIDNVDLKTRKTKWICRCDCGTIKPIRGQDLRSGLTISCGCYQTEIRGDGPRKPKGESAFNSVYSSYKSGARKRELDFKLTKEEFKELISDNCSVCGVEPDKTYKARQYTNGEYKYNGIDRVDNNIGYIKENCVTMCTPCNFGKHSLSQEKFMNWIERLVRYQLKNNKKLTQAVMESENP